MPPPSLDVPIPDDTKEMMLDNLNQQAKGGYDAIYNLAHSEFRRALPDLSIQCCRG